MKTEKELNELKEEIKKLNEKFAALSDEELAEVTGGTGSTGGHYCKYCKRMSYQYYKGEGYGWDTNKEQWPCNLYECSTCHCTNYYRIDNDQLI